MAESRLNIELFKKIRDRIAEIPESYDQSLWARRDSKAPCGTTACLAGEAIICSRPTAQEGVALLWRTLNELRTPSPDVLARDLLRLTPNEASAMFTASACAWPAPFSVQFDRARSRKGRAKAAIAYLDHIIETGKVLE